nr:hypothetical protein [Tanacetum cinerariifolium]
MPRLSSSPGLIRARPCGGAATMDLGMHPAMGGDRQWRCWTRLAAILDKGLPCFCRPGPWILWLGAETDYDRAMII